MKIDINISKKEEYLIEHFEKKDLQISMLKYYLAQDVLLNSIYGLVKEFEYFHHYNPVEHIKSRIKSEKSIIRKLKEKNCEITVSNMIQYVHDVVGVRIVCSFISEVYDIVHLLKCTKQFEIIEEEDYIKNPKETGYTSYHLLLKVPIYLKNGCEFVIAEVQIRTIAMDFWASLDHKIQYKFSGTVPKEVEMAMYGYSLDIKNLEQKMHSLNQMMNRFQNK